MYQRIVLAYDGSAEGRIALREGALMAKRMGAQVFFLAVIPESPGSRMAEGGHPGAVAHEMDKFNAIFEDGLARLQRLGLKPVARLVRGEPSREIATFARQNAADLVVVSLRRQGMWSRWWSGDTGAYLSDSIGCSLLIARSLMTDAEFDAELRQMQPGAPAACAAPQA